MSSSLWTSKLDYVLTLVGYSVGFANIWRFPYICQRNGGGAFLFPYLLAMVTVAMPLFFLEVLIGQFSRRGPIGAWGLCPLMKGVGVSQVLLSALVVPYYSVVFTWAMYYLYKSCFTSLPWATCDNAWNDDTCFTGSDQSNRTNSSVGTFTMNSAAEQFWRKDVLALSPGINHVGSVQLHLAVAWLVTCLIIFICVCKGIRVIGKVVYVTALVPYLLLTVLLVRSAMMPGAVDGVLLYITPDFTKLGSAQVWLDALTQAFFSVGPAWGVIISMSSHNLHTNNAAWDAFIVTMVGELTSLFSGFVVFAGIGALAHEHQIPVTEAVKEGPGLVFIIYPEALSLLPVPQLWSVLFFFVLLLVGIDSTLTYAETVVSSLEETFSRHFRGMTHFHAVMAAIYILFVVILGLPFTTNAGMFMFELVDWYLPAVALFIIGALECIIVSWLYGIRRFCVDVEYMLERQPPVIFKIFFCFITPAILLTGLAVTLINHAPPTYGLYKYPPVALVIGWFLAIVTLVPVPVTMVIMFVRKSGSLSQRLKSLLEPDSNWDRSTQRCRGEEFELWAEEKTFSPLENTRFIFTREKPV